MKRAGGGKRKGGGPARGEPDDRPRGYESRRMRQLWNDIDQAKHKAGIGRSREAAPPPPWWDVGAALARANALAGEAAAWVTATAPAACTLLASGAALLRQVPVVGRLVELVPVPTPSVHPRPSRPEGAPVTVDVPFGEPNGHWVD